MRPNGLTYTLLCLSLAASSLEAATAKKLKADKQVVILSEGKGTGYQKKKKVCFFDANKQKVACGVIRASKSKVSSVHIKDPTEFAKVSVGMTAMIEVDFNKNVKIKIDENAPTGPVEPEYKAPIYVALFGGFPIKESTTYNNLIYDTPLGKPASSMWKTESAVSAVSLGAEIGIGIKSFTLALGARQRTYSPKRIASDYGNANAQGKFPEYVESIGKAKASGAWVDFYYAHWNWGVATLNLGNGIDVDNSNVTFYTDHRSDLDKNVYNIFAGKSKLQAISLRTPLVLDIKFGPVGFKIGSVLYIPLSEVSKVTVENNDPLSAQFLNGKTSEVDFKEKLGHKGQVGFDILFMGYAAY